MDDFDSLSTVVTNTTPKGKGDDFDSFSSVVDAPKPTASKPAAKVVAPAPKPGIWDRTKAAVSEGLDNLATEQKQGKLVDNLVRGGIHSVFSVAGGIGQLVGRGMEAGANKLAPGSDIAQWAKDKRIEAEQENQKWEDNYQRDTKGSVAAGFGRVGGSLAIPLGAASKAEKGATLASKIGTASYNGAKVAAVQPVYDVTDKDGAQFAKEKAGQVAVGATLGAAAPVAGKVLLETASKLGSKAAERALTRTRAAQLFDKSPNAKADAEVITELGGIKDRVGDRKLLTQDLNARQNRITAETKDAMTAAGATPEQLTQLKTWQGMTAAEKEAFRSTEMGQPVAAIMDKLDRIRALTPGELSSNLLGPVRGALDLAPIPAPVRFGLKNLLGGRTTRAESAAKMLDPRSQRAAQEYLAQNGASDATKGAQTLQDMSSALSNKTDAESLTLQRLAAQNKAMTDNPSLLVPGLADPAERSLKNQNLKDWMLARAKDQDKLDKLKGKQNGPYPSLVVPGLRDPGDMGKGSKALKNDIMARMNEQNDATNAAKLKDIQLVARRVTGTPGGGAYQTLMEHTGLSPDELNKALRVVSRLPNVGDEANKIRVGGGNTSDGAIYPITDLVKSVSEKMGTKQGALSQVQPAGSLSGETERVTARYQMATKNRQAMYDKAKADANALGDPQVRSEAADLAEWLKSTPKRTERVQRIDEFSSKYPEAAKIFSAVRKFK